MSEPGRDFATGDDPARCALCGRETSLAMIATHLEREHGVTPEDLANAYAYDDESELDDLLAGEDDGEDL